MLLDLPLIWSTRGLCRPLRYEQINLPIFNIAPTPPAIAVPPDDIIIIMKRGLVPGWAKDVKIGNGMIHARDEALAERPAFHTDFRKRRRAVPADGFYKWQKPDTPKGTKQPDFIHWAGDEPRVFAGLW